MSDVDQRRVAILMQEDEFDEALSLLKQLFGKAELAVAPERPDLFMTMFQWRLLANCHEPARAALRDVRDAQAERLLAGDLYFDADGDPAGEEFHRIRRFSLIVEINVELQELTSTCAIFLKLHADHPRLSQRYARLALPALVDQEYFELADQYRGDPLKSLESVNDVALALPLYPNPRGAPRLAAELMNLVADVHLGMAVLRGLGHGDQADALGDALLAGLDSNELKSLARRELDAPGTITRELVDHQMAQEALAAEPQR